MKRKAISLMSGGLDSAVATRLILEQGIEVVGLHYTSPFASRRERERGLQVIETARELGIRLIKREKGPGYRNVLLHPKYGYGKNMNPCIDCRIFMLKETRAVMDEEHAGFVVTGEVLGQRPMSQRRETIELIEKESGMAGLILRPLSAKLFPPSLPEQSGIVDRDRLLGIAGRGRSAQYELVATYHLKEYSCPGGGCLLTDRIFSYKLRELVRCEPDFTPRDIDLLNLGRHFRLAGGEKLVVGRNEAENNQLHPFSESPYVYFQPVDFTGPSAVLKGNPREELIRTVVSIMANYGRKEGPSAEVAITADGFTRTRRVEITDPDIESLQVHSPRLAANQQ